MSEMPERSHSTSSESVSRAEIKTERLKGGLKADLEKARGWWEEEAIPTLQEVADKISAGYEAYLEAREPIPVGQGKQREALVGAFEDSLRISSAIPEVSDTYIAGKESYDLYIERRNESTHNPARLNQIAASLNALYQQSGVEEGYLPVVDTRGLSSEDKDKAVETRILRDWEGVKDKLAGHFLERYDEAERRFCFLENDVRNKLQGEDLSRTEARDLAYKLQDARTTLLEQAIYTARRADGKDYGRRLAKGIELSFKDEWDFPDSPDTVDGEDLLGGVDVQGKINRVYDEYVGRLEEAGDEKGVALAKGLEDGGREAYFGSLVHSSEELWMRERELYNSVNVDPERFCRMFAEVKKLRVRGAISEADVGIALAVRSSLLENTAESERYSRAKKVEKAMLGIKSKAVGAVDAVVQVTQVFARKSQNILVEPIVKTSIVAEQKLREIDTNLRNESAAVSAERNRKMIAVKGGYFDSRHAVEHLFRNLLVRLDPVRRIGLSEQEKIEGLNRRLGEIEGTFLEKDLEQRVRLLEGDLSMKETEKKLAGIPAGEEKLGYAVASVDKRVLPELYQRAKDNVQKAKEGLESKGGKKWKEKLATAQQELKFVEQKIEERTGKPIEEEEEEAPEVEEGREDREAELSGLLEEWDGKGIFRVACREPRSRKPINLTFSYDRSEKKLTRVTVDENKGPEESKKEDSLEVEDLDAAKNTIGIDLAGRKEKGYEVSLVESSEEGERKETNQAAYLREIRQEYGRNKKKQVENHPAWEAARIGDDTAKFDQLDQEMGRIVTRQEGIKNIFGATFGATGNGLFAQVFGELNEEAYKRRGVDDRNVNPLGQDLHDLVEMAWDYYGEEPSFRYGKEGPSDSDIRELYDEIKGIYKGAEMDGDAFIAAFKNGGRVSEKEDEVRRRPERRGGKEAGPAAYLRGEMVKYRDYETLLARLNNETTPIPKQEPSKRKRTEDERRQYNQAKNELTRIDGLFRDRFGEGDDGLFYEAFGRIKTQDDKAQTWRRNQRRRLIEGAVMHFGGAERSDHVLRTYYREVRTGFDDQVKMTEKEFLKAFKNGGVIVRKEREAEEVQVTEAGSRGEGDGVEGRAAERSKKRKVIYGSDGDERSEVLTREEETAPKVSPPPQQPERPVPAKPEQPPKSPAKPEEKPAPEESELTEEQLVQKVEDARRNLTEADDGLKRGRVTEQKRKNLEAAEKDLEKAEAELKTYRERREGVEKVEEVVPGAAPPAVPRVGDLEEYEKLMRQSRVVEEEKERKRKPVSQEWRMVEPEEGEQETVFEGEFVEPEKSAEAEIGESEAVTDESGLRAMTEREVDAEENFSMWEVVHNAEEEVDKLTQELATVKAEERGDAEIRNKQREARKCSEAT